MDTGCTGLQSYAVVAYLYCVTHSHIHILAGDNRQRYRRLHSYINTLYSRQTNATMLAKEKEIEITDSLSTEAHLHVRRD